MSFDPLVTNPGRLSILTSLASRERLEFVELRHATRMTDGNLATHARRLESAGLISMTKSMRAGRPVTTITLTGEGRAALTEHLQQLMNAIGTPLAAAREPAHAELVFAESAD